MRKSRLIKLVFTIVLVAAVGLVLTACQEDNGKKDSETSSQTESGITGPERVSPDIYSAVPVITVDKQGNPHLISYETTNEDLLYSTKTSGDWMTETVDQEGNVGDGHDIALDKNGNPHISYRDITNGSVKYAKKENGDWQTETVDTPPVGDRIEATSIEIDADGNPHIAYSISLAGEFKYASWNGSDWDIESPGIDGQFVNLALDSSGNPHIAAISESAQPHLKYVKMTGSVWEEEIVDEATVVRYDPFIQLDDNDNPHIAYRNAPTRETTNSVKYASWNGTDWDLDVVKEKEVSISEGSQMGFSMIDSMPYIVFAQPGEGLLLATMSGGSWTFEDVGPASVCTIAVDNMDKSHIAYTDAGSGQVKGVVDTPADEDVDDEGGTPVDTPKENGEVTNTEGDDGSGEVVEDGPIEDEEVVMYVLVN